jgi:hypothetical protein
MMGRAKYDPLDRIEGLLRRRETGPAPRLRTGRSTGLLGTIAAAGGDGASCDPPSWAFEPDRIPWLEGAEYRYRHGRHGLILAIEGVTGSHEAAVGLAEAEFALIVEGPLLILGSRFGHAAAWSWSAPYNWHFAPTAERIVPAAIALTPESFSRLWATLWITLVDVGVGRVRVRRAVALHPGFTHALQGVLRAQALRPFRGEEADRAWDSLLDSSRPLSQRILARARCAAASDYAGRWARTRPRRDDAA